MSIGIDIVDIKRIENMVLKYGDKFTKKVFTPSEIKYCFAKTKFAQHFAGRWAAKEAFYKAISDKCQKISTWKSIEILSKSADGGKPSIKILSKELDRLMKSDGVVSVDVSISHEKHYCISIVNVV